MSNDIRKAGNYNIINSIHIGDKEFVLGVDMKNSDNQYYMVADYERNELFERYINVIVGDNFLEIAEIYSNRLKEQVETTKEAEKAMPKGIITDDMCDSITDKDLGGKIIVIDPNMLRPEYRTEAHQIVRCTGGNGANPTARGSAVFCDYLHNNEHTRFERYDVLGILKKEYYPEWLTRRLELEKAIKDHNVFEYGGYHFLPVGVVKGANQLKYISNHTFSDRDLRIWTDKYAERYGKNKIDYKHKEFYKACNNIHCDIFKCLENGKVYIPAENELFEYTGEYAPYEEKTLKDTNLTFVEANQSEVDRDKFFKTDSGFTEVYYNPDADAGGQLVYNEISLDLIREAAQSSKKMQDFFSHLDSGCTQYLIDIDTPEFKGNLDSFISRKADFEKCNAKTMRELKKAAGIVPEKSHSEKEFEK